MASAEKPYVGGQAVIEGVMMRAPRSLAIAVRRPDGTIVLRDDAWISIWETLRFLRAPGLRGAIVLFESLYNGIQALNFASAQAEHGSGEETEPAGSSAGTAATIALSFVLAIALFVGLPHGLAWASGFLAGAPLEVDSFAFHALDGVFKVGIFVGYIAAISRIPEIRRVFEYHGAEHKVVNVYEAGEPMTMENARAKTTFHARCGTSFVLFVLLLSIFMFAAIFPFIPKVSDFTLLNHLAMVLIKIPLMIPLAGLAYEINRFAARHPEQLWVQLIVKPGRWMQRLTTKEPDDAQLEIAMAAMQAAIRREESLGALVEPRPAPAAPVRSQVLVFKNYAELCATVAPGH